MYIICQKTSESNLAVEGPHLILCRLWSHFLDKIYKTKARYECNCTARRAKKIVEISSLLPKNEETAGLPLHHTATEQRKGVAVERQLNAGAQPIQPKGIFRNGQSFLKLVLYMEERPWPYSCVMKPTPCLLVLGQK